MKIKIKFLALFLVALSVCGIVIGMDQPTLPIKEISSTKKPVFAWSKTYNIENNGPIAVSSDGKKMVSVAKNGKSFSLFLAQKEGTEDFVQKEFDSPCAICSCATISPDGNTIAIATNKCLLFMNISDLDNKKMGGAEFPNTIKSLVFSRDSKRMISLDESSNIKIWDISNFQAITGSGLFAGGENISDVVINSDGSKVIAIAGNKFIAFDVKKSSSGTMNIVKKTGVNKYPLNGIVMSPHDECFIVWDSANKMQLCDFDSETSDVYSRPMTGYKKNIASVAFSPDGKYIASVGEDGFVLWNKENASILCAPSGKTESLKKCSMMAFSNDSKKIFLCNDSPADKDYELICYDIQKIATRNVGQSEPEFIVNTQISKDIKLSKLSFNDEDKKIILSGLQTVVMTLSAVSEKEVIKEVVKKKEEVVDANKSSGQEGQKRSKKKKRDKSGRKEKRAAAAQLKSSQAELNNENVVVQSTPSTNDQKSGINAAVNEITNVQQEQKAVSSSSPLRVIENFAHAVSTVLNPNKRKESFLQQGITYAAAVHPSARRIEDPIKKKTIHFQDTYLEIYVPNVWKKRDKNPLLVPHSRHVTEAKENDHFHNISILVHKKLGKYVDAEVFVDPKYESYTGTKYTIPGNVILPSNKENIPGKKVSGTFEFTVVKNQKNKKSKLIHNFFNPDKSIDKKKTA